LELRISSISLRKNEIGVCNKGQDRIRRINRIGSRIMVKVAAAVVAVAAEVVDVVEGEVVDEAVVVVDRVNRIT
jgi:hypothetical protein